MPNVKPGESQNDFVDRCVPFVINEGTTKDPKQAAAICNSMWKEHAKKDHSADATIMLSASMIEQSDMPKNNFKMLAYTGGVMSKNGWEGVFDISGMSTKSKKVVILREHDRSQIIGSGSIKKEGGNLLVEGTFTSNSAGFEMMTLLNDGVPMQCSVGIIPVAVTLSDGKMEVNGKRVPADVEIWNKSILGEVSMTIMGVDNNTSVEVFAREIQPNGGQDMSIIEGIVEKVAEAVSEVAEVAIEVTEVAAEAYVEKEVAEAEVKAEVAEAAVEVATDVVSEVVEVALSQDDTIKCAVEAAIAGERARIASLFAADAPMELTMKAITEGMSEGDAFKMFYMETKQFKAKELTKMAAEMPELPAVTKEAVVVSAGAYEGLVAARMDEKKCSRTEAMKFVIKNHNDAYQAYKSGLNN